MPCAQITLNCHQQRFRSRSATASPHMLFEQDAVQRRIHHLADLHPPMVWAVKEILVAFKTSILGNHGVGLEGS